MSKVKVITICAIVLLAFSLRIFNINWDGHCCMHPDERAIVMYTLPLHLPTTLQEFLSPQSPLNPHFFAYGNFPLYLLKGASILVGYIDASYMQYDKLDLVGRFISTLADSGTVILLYAIGKKLFNNSIGLIAAFLYAIAVFPIQASHFYTVDILLTFFISFTLYRLLCFYENSSFKNSLLVGLGFGLSLVTKISSLPLLAAIVASIGIDFFLVFLKNPRHSVWISYIQSNIKLLVRNIIVITSTTLITFIILQPYALIDYESFLKQTIEQSRMTKDAFVFPYTLQYVGITPYVYELKNVFLWGLGPVSALLSFCGIVYIVSTLYKKRIQRNVGAEVLLLIFFFVYFGVVGSFAVGWMRYMLPLYPLFCLFAAVFISAIVIPFLSSFLYITGIKKTNTRYSISLILLLLFSSLWTVSFMHIYTQENTRIQASKWITTTIAPGKKLAIEHWDDGLPIFGGEQYIHITLPLYDPDTSFKWADINQKLSESDYIIIASNRLYTPLQKLTDCNKLPPLRCYSQTAQYYRSLFSGTRGFKKIAEFAVYPTVPLLNIPIDDQGADESFTVYDHPKIMIFKKNENTF